MARWTLRTSSRNRSGSSRRTGRLPRTAMALMFFDPMTAPIPERPLTRLPLDTSAAKRTRFSPATPIDATWMSQSP